MIRQLLLGAAALALATPALAQQAGHGGMTMPMPAKKKAPAKKPAAKKPVAKKPVAKKPAIKKPVARKPVAATPSVAAPAATPVAPPPPPPPPPPVEAMPDHAAMDHSAHQPAPEAPVAPAVMEDHSAHSTMTAALGPYPLAREASGTAWQPDSAEHGGVTAEAGGWTLMAHASATLVHSSQSGPRGDDKTFVAGMMMGSARRQLGPGTVQFRAMVSPDPLMGKSGYPLLLASGETANGVDRLIDRQHPHDFFMDLSASYSLPLGGKNSAFIYAGLPGEPAFGPPAFMHRQSILDSPEAPITHHWLDSTHITFGVITAGLVLDRFKIEASRFNGREPDEHRFNIETGKLDSSAIRLSWNPTDRLSLQGSWAHLEDAEQLEPGVNQKRWSASGIYTVPMARGWWSTTLAWGRKSLEGHDYDALALESAVKRDNWTLFGRAEYAENNELTEVEHGPTYKVGKASLGLVRDFRLTESLKLGVGGLYALNFIPDDLEPVYGGDRHGAMMFVRLKLD